MKTVTFAKDHNYGGHAFKKGEKLQLPETRAKTLEKAGVLEKAKKKKDES